MDFEIGSLAVEFKIERRHADPEGLEGAQRVPELQSESISVNFPKGHDTLPTTGF